MQTERARSVVELDGKQAQQTLDLLKSKATELRQEMQKAFKANDLESYKKYEAELRTTESAMKNFKKSSFDADAVLKNLNGSTLKDLQKAQSAITNQLRNMERGTDEYVSKSKDLQLVRKEIASVKGEMNGVVNSQEGWLSKTNNFFSKWGGMIAGIAATFAGLALSLNKFKDFALDIEDSKAALSSITGLGDDAVERLGASAERMSSKTTDAGVRITKTANEIIDAYTLMGSAKPELLQNEEGLNKVTEGALTLAEAAEMETKPAVESLATVMNQFDLGSENTTRTINVLAAGSQAGAEEVDGLSASIKNFGPAANSANVSLEQSVALVEALSEKGVKGAESGTGIRNFLLTLQSGADDTNPKIVGLEQALDNLAKKNMSAAAMVKMFGKENYVTASLLISNRDRVQELTKAVTGTNVAYEQAIKNTDTTRAKAAQARNEFMLKAKILGEKLAPAMSTVTNIGTKLLVVLVNIPTILKVMTPAILGVTAAWIAHEISLIRSTAAARAYIVVNNFLKTSLNNIKTLFATNPVTAWIAAIGILTTVFLTLREVIKSTNSIGAEFIANVQKEKSELDSAFDALKKTSEGTLARKEAIKLINEKYGEYLPNLLTEKSSLQEIEKAQQSVTKALIQRLAVAAKEKEIQAMMEKRSQQGVDATKNIMAYLRKNNGESATQIIITEIGEAIDKYIRDLPGRIKAINDIKKKYKIGDGADWDIFKLHMSRSSIDSEKKNIEDFYKSYLKILGIKDTLDSGGGGGNDGVCPKCGNPKDKCTCKNSPSDDDKYDEELEKLDDWLLKKQSKFKQDYLNQKLAKQIFDEEMLALELTYLIKQKALQERYGKSSLDTQNKILDKKISRVEKSQKEIQDSEKEWNDFMADMDKDFWEGLNQIHKDLLEEKQKNIKKNNDDIDKEQEDQQKKREDELKQYNDVAQEFAKNLGQTIGDYIGGVLEGERSFANAMINIALDALHNTIQIAIAQIVAKEIATKGWIGILTGAALTAVVETAFAVAKAAVRPVSQRAEGKYDVLAEDGRHYSAEWNETPITGVYSKPTLFAERGSELIVDNTTLNRLRLNTPWVLDEIMRQRVPQRENGKFDVISNGNSQPVDLTMMRIIESNMIVMNELSGILKRGVGTTMSMSHFKDSQEKYDAILEAAKRK